MHMPIPPEKLKIFFKTASYLLIAAGLIINGWAWLTKYAYPASIDAMFIFLGNTLPYIVAAYIFKTANRIVVFIGTAILFIYLDIDMIIEVFIHPTSSTSAIMLVLVPIFKIAIILVLSIVVLLFNFISRKLHR